MARRITFTDHAWDDYQHWQRADRKLHDRINTLINAAVREPFTGIGKPESLRGNWAGAWSRRIDSEHRLVYEVRDNDLIVLACRYHYGTR